MLRTGISSLSSMSPVADPAVADTSAPVALSRMSANVLRSLSSMSSSAVGMLMAASVLSAPMVTVKLVAAV